MIRPVLPTVCGLLMVAAAAGRADGVELVPVAASAVAVLAGIRWRPAATLAVLCAVATIAVSGPAPMFTALAGLAAATYLLLRHGEHTVTPPGMLAAAGFGALATVVAAIPVQLPWLPLAAPLALFGGYLIALRPYLRAA
ncbi:hypothetical protein JRC04_13730 [Mycolicibacterium sp. S2-37]|uniref:hypothetical protein n=1 Tax=Mycolicibacterium sp. S2-37 TaxID=2810297 RepID=UPI001A9405FB|nr:hypothetical protein [Mycolicibacterium sp. S2-37]MBO0678525.1 hypothetical protein [Mycolicibacterium sp. S2-37]